MDFFTLIDGSAVLLYSQGTYRQVAAYRRGTKIYAKYGSGFILLSGYKGTTAPKVVWMEIEAQGVELQGAGKAPVYVGD